MGDYLGKETTTRPQQSTGPFERTSQLVEVEHIRVSTARPFSEVVRRLDAETGFFDAAAIQARVQGRVPPRTIIEAIAAMAGPSGFMRFAALDHGAILRLQGRSAEAIRFLIGHPLTASRMTSLRIGSALYAPLSLLIAAEEGGGTRLEYDRPSTLLGQFADPGVAQVARELDEKFAALVDAVAGSVEKVS